MLRLLNCKSKEEMLAKVKGRNLGEELVNDLNNLFSQYNVPKLSKEDEEELKEEINGIKKC